MTRFSVHTEMLNIPSNNLTYKLWDFISFIGCYDLKRFISCVFSGDVSTEKVV
jgi:hypothetical protein